MVNILNQTCCRWAGLYQKEHRRSNKTQNAFLNQLFHSGVKSRNKITAEKAEQSMCKQFDSRDYLTVTTIKSYFSRRAAKKKKGEIIEDDVVMINADSSCDETESEADSDYDDEGMDMLDTTREKKLEKERTVLNQKISVAVTGVDIQKKNGLQLLTQENGFQHSSFNLTQSRRKHKSTF